MSGTVGVIGVGEVGSGITRALLGSGHSVIAHDVRVADAQARLAGVAHPERLRFGELAEAAACEMVVSAVVPGVAIDVARRLADGGLVEGAYLDVNSTGPEEKQEIARIARDGGFGTFTDGTISGGGFRLPPGPVFCLAGPDAHRWDALLTGAGFRTEILGTTLDDVGKAATLKMLRSVFTKGYEGLLVESLLAARRFGLLDHVVASIGTSFDHLSFAQLADLMVRGHVQHVDRRAEEVEMAIATVGGEGEPVPMLDGTLERFRVDSRILGDRRGRPEPADLEAALDLLLHPDGTGG